MEKGKSLEVRSCFVMGSGLTHVEGERDGKKEMWWEAGHKKMYLRIKRDGRMSGNKTQRPDESMLKRVCVPVCVHVCVPLRVHVRVCACACACAWVCAREIERERPNCFWGCDFMAGTNDKAKGQGLSLREADTGGVVTRMQEIY